MPVILTFQSRRLSIQDFISEYLLYKFPPHALYIFCSVIFIFTSLSKLSVKNHQNKLCGSILKTVKKQPFLT